VSAAAELAVSRVAEIAPPPKEDQWLVKGLWGRSAVGILGGQPKCMKTWLGLEMAVSVASGTACLDRFAVAAPGPALVFLAEDALGQVRERIEGLCRRRGRRLDALDLLVITEPVLRLDDRSCRERLENTVARHRPRLLLLDPLVRLHGLDENSSHDVSRLLGHLRELERRYGVSVVLVHHASKRRRAHPGQSLRGSSDLHAWTDTTAILTRRNEHVVLALEHRFAAAPEPLVLGLVGEGGAAPALRIVDGEAGLVRSPGDPNVLAERVLDVVREAARPLRRGEIRAQVRVNNQRLGEVLRELEQGGRLDRGPGGWVAGRSERKRREEPRGLFATEIG